MNLLKSAFVCVAIAVICGCDQGQPTPPALFDATKKDAESGDAKAQFVLGVMYQNGHGVAKDSAEAVKWYRLAADQGLADAQFVLGVMYHTGQGVPQDYAEAMKWYRLAADQGHPDAQFALGMMYYNGEGVPQDHAEAYAWFSVAAAGGLAEAVKNRDIAAGVLTPEQLSQGQKRAGELLEKIGSGK